MQIISGPNAVIITLENSAKLCIQLYLNNDSLKINQRLQQVYNLAAKLAIKTALLKKIQWLELVKKYSLNNEQGVVLIAKPQPLYDIEWLQNKIAAKPNSLLLALEEVQDPQNFGSCLRTADAAGVDAVIIKRNNQSPITNVVNKAAAGAVATVPIVSVTNFASTLEKLKNKGFWIVGFSDKAQQSMYNIDFKKSVLLILGSEGRGLRNLTEKKCDYLCNIPMQGKISCLNLSVSTGIALYEVIRQRNL